MLPFFFDIQHAGSLFKDHALQPDNLSPSLHITDKQYWISWLIIGCFTAIVWMISTDRKKLNLLISAAISNRNVDQLIRKEYAISNRLSIVLSVLFLFISALFINQANIHFNWINTDPENIGLFFIKTLVVLTLFFTIKIIMIKTIGFIFEREQESFWHIFNIFLFNEVIGLFIFPFIVISQFSSSEISKVLIYLTGGVLIIMYAYKFLRLLLLAGTNREISTFHLFLYLCTLEILPLVVVMKLFVSRI